MARSTQPLSVGKVIGDVIDHFVPSIDMVVSYPLRQISNGCEMKPCAVSDQPSVKVGGGTHHPDSALFTIIMTDPDAPSPSEPSMREWVHWIVTDIPAGSDATQGTEIVGYDAPKPSIGIHRYVFVAFKQLGPLAVMPPTLRNNFSTREFAAIYRLGSPVAAVYFNCQKHAAGRRRFSP